MKKDTCKCNVNVLLWINMPNLIVKLTTLNNLWDIYEVVGFIQGKQSTLLSLQPTLGYIVHVHCYLAYADLNSKQEGATDQEQIITGLWKGPRNVVPPNHVNAPLRYCAERSICCMTLIKMSFRAANRIFEAPAKFVFEALSVLFKEI